MAASRHTTRARTEAGWEDKMRAQLRRASTEALAVLEGIMHAESVKEADRIRAAEAILDRGYGRSAPAQSGETPQIVFIGGEGLGD